jgi:hypothetical protein
MFRRRRCVAFSSVGEAATRMLDLDDKVAIELAIDELRNKICSECSALGDASPRRISPSIPGWEVSLSCPPPSQWTGKCGQRAQALIDRVTKT